MPGSQVGAALTMSLFGAMVFGAGTDNRPVPNFYRNRC